MKRIEKEQMVATLGDLFSGNQIGLLVDYRGLNVAEISELRRMLHEKSTKMRILKNRLAKRAIKETPFAALEDLLTEPRALIYGDDPVAPAKVITKFMSGNDKLQYISGILITKSGGSILDLPQMKALGSLPSREELLTQLVFLMKGVQTQFVRTLHEIPSKFVRTLAAIASSKEAG